MITFSIITPTIQRQSLIRCCRSVNEQSYAHWQHVVAVDSAEMNSSLIDRIVHPQRTIFVCGQRFGHYGNHARWMAWEKATKDYLLALDDDNALFHPDALADIADCLVVAQLPAFAIFPIHRHGCVFFSDPPGMCQTDSANLVIRRELGRWPDVPLREADGLLAEQLKQHYQWAGFPNCRPIVLMEASSNGQ